MEASYLILGAAICGLGALLGMYVADEDSTKERASEMYGCGKHRISTKCAMR